MIEKGLRVINQKKAHTQWGYTKAEVQNIRYHNVASMAMVIYDKMLGKQVYVKHTLLTNLLIWEEDYQSTWI